VKAKNSRFWRGLRTRQRVGVLRVPQHAQTQHRTPVSTPKTTASAAHQSRAAALKKLTWTQYLRLSFRFAKLSYKAFVRKHRLLSRIVAIALVFILLFSLWWNIWYEREKITPQPISSAVEQLIGTPIKQYASLLTSEKGGYAFNKEYAPLSGGSGDSAKPKITAQFSDSTKNNEVSVKDPVNNVSLAITPTFATGRVKSNSNRVIYPINGKKASTIYTLKATGVKEDIVLEAATKDEMTFEYKVTVSEGTEMRMEQDGSVAVYGVNQKLLGNVSTGTDKDAELLKNARQNGEKNNLLFRIPAPFVKEFSKRSSRVRTWFSLQGDKLTVHASGLKAAVYPLTIDPSIYVESAAKLMRGNNETNVDFDTSNELIQKSQTTGARIDYWTDTTPLNTGVWDQSMAAAGGYVYRAGGRTDPVAPYIASQQTSTQATTSTTFTMAMPTTRPAGDLYVALIARQGTGAITAPGGWTLISSTREAAAYYRIGTNVSGGNEAASYAWTIGTGVEWTGVIVRIKGFDSATPISGTAGTGSSASAAVPAYPAVTPSHDATLILRTVGVNDDEPTEATWLPLGHTRITSGTSSSSATSVGIAASYLDQPPLASNAAAAANFVSDGILNDTYGAISVAIKPAAVTAGVQNTLEWAKFNTTSSAIDAPNPGNGVCSGWCTDSVYNLPAARVGASMYAYNGYLYVMGGTTDVTTAAAANATSTVWVAKLGANGEPQLWHPTGGTPAYWFVSSTTLPSARSYSQIYAYNNRMYLVGGRDTSGNSLNTVHEADILPTGDLAAWTTTGMQDLTTPTARHGHSIHMYNEYMYIIGGVTTTGGGSSNTFRNTVYYSKINSDGTMNTWQATSSFTTARSSFGGQMTTLAGGYVYLSGGCTALTSGYCSTIASDVQLASINSDGSLAPWNSILTLSNQKIGYTLMTWQGGLYRFGGCNRQNTSTGLCYSVHQANGFGVINPAGDASTVSNSEPNGTAPCSGVSMYNCDLPPAGDTAGTATGGQMSSMVVINNGYIYNIGGCITPGSSCTNMSGNTSYAALNSIGQMVAPASCPSGLTYGLWCIDSTNQLNGTAGLGAAGATVFNNVIYIAGGTDSSNWQANMYRVTLNSDGSFAGPWQSQTFTAIGLPTGTADDARGYMYMFTRSNPASAGTNPGNLYMLGGCQAAGAGIGCQTYYTETIKCNIQVAGTLTGCSTTGQMQVDADNINAGNQGIGLMAGTVYANRIYLVGGACTQTGAAGDPCGSTYSGNRKDTIYAKIDNSNNIVDATTGLSTGAWSFTTAQMSPVRRRAVSFGYNGYIYSLAGYSGSSSLQDLLFAKINVSTGDISSFDSSGVVVTPRWDLRAIVSNGYVYAIGGCGTGAAPAGCSAMQPEVQTFQLYNNDSGTPVGYSASANLMATDRMGASSTILNGYLYVAGGCTSATDCTTATTSVEYAAIDIYGNLGAWATGGSLPAVRTWGQLESVGGTLYYIGGQDSTSTNEQSTVYYTTGISAGNPTWSGTAATNGLPAARTQFSATVWDSRIYVTGGLDGTAVSTTTTYISPKLSSGGDITTAWTTSTAFNVARSGHATVAYANNLYVLGGYDGTNYLNDVQFASIGYKTGTITQTNAGARTTTVTGSGTTFTTSMIGSTLQYLDGETATITAVASATSMTVSISKLITTATGYTILDGSVGSWTYTTSMPTAIRQADVFAANGYMYVVGGRSADGNCIPNTVLAPISANTTIASGNNPTGLGEWYETNAKYTGNRYGNSVAYYNGKLYITGGACEMTPDVSSIITQNFTTDVTTHNVTMPATVDAGDLLIVLFSNDGSATVTDPDGAGAWTQISTQVDSGNNIRGSVWAIDAAGTEDGTNVNFQTSATERATSQVYRIPASLWEGNIASVAAASVDNGSGTAPNPPNFDPAGWGTENTLWIAYAATSSHTSITSYPTNYTNGTFNISNAGGGNAEASTFSARRAIRAAAEDPGAFTLGGGNAPGVSFTIAVRPPTFAYTGANRVVQSALYSQPQVAAYSRMIDTDTDVFPTGWLMNGLDNSIGARWQARYRSMHDIATNTDTVNGTLQQNPNEDCGTSLTMPTMTTWGQDTAYGNVTLGDVASYTALNSSGGNINCARYFYFYVNIDASQTFGYPEDVNRGPTINDLSLFFTSDPSKRLRHGKTFTGGEQQPLDTPCRQTVDPQCPLP